MDKAVVCINGWAGRIESPCYVIGETPKKYRIKADQDIELPRKTLFAGESALVPKSAVRLESE